MSTTAAAAVAARAQDSVTPPAVQARSLGYSYPSGRRGVAELDLEAGAGERVVVLGPNGSGKSTLLQLLAGLLRPREGAATVLGSDSATLTVAQRRRTGVALDHVVHWEALTALENVVLLARAAGLAAREAAAAAEPLLARFALESGVPVREYSLGMKRKLMLVQALVHDPELILLDEPTLGLDPAGIEALVTALRVRAEAGATVLVATNDVASAQRLATRVVFLLEGRKVADEAAHTLLATLRSRTRIEVTLSGDARAAAALLERPGSPADLTLRLEKGSLVAESQRGAEPLPDLLRWLLEQGAKVRDVRVREPGLADVFRELTGKTLAEESLR